MEVHHEISQLHALLEKALGGAPDIAVLHGLELGQQGALGHQLVDGGDDALNGAVVEQHVGILGPGVEIFQREVHGGKAVAAVGQVRKDVIAARQFDHLGHIVAALADIGEVVGRDGEKGAGLAGGRLVGQRGNALGLCGEHLLGQLLFAQQDAPEFDPLHPGEGAALVAGAFHQRRDAEPFQLLLDLRGVEDHGVLNGEAAIGG